ncbi:ComEC/Rec2 family competence protein [Enterocloster lavalensis]|uniref:ComEC/Rec2 family competence protein n=1 Tax=Enterocloster lavalensis TaxID=460384 RepID=UPI002A80B2BF|nr:ComEC/Rec2 family competence protein [Enterocloster lavalensis]
MTIKRPLLGLAGSFVLGEVLALLDVAAIPWITGAFAAACAAVVLGKRRAKRRLNGAGDGARSAPGPGLRRSRGTGFGVLLLFLAALLAGFGRAQGVRDRLDGEAAWAGKTAGVKVSLTGTVERMEEKEDQTELWLRDAAAKVGKEGMEFGRVVVYADSGVAVGGDLGSGVRVGGGLESGVRVGGGAGSGAAVGIGSVVRLRGKLEAVAGATNPGEFDFARYYRSKGAACRLYGEELTVADREMAPYFEGIRRFRLWCARVLERVCEPGDLGVFKAVVLGDQSSMDQGMKDMYRSHGISHLLAVSGQHLAIVGGGIYLLLRKAGMNRGRAGMFGGALVVSYGILTGGSGSALRAVVMILCLWLAGYLGRSYDCLSAMGLAGMWLLWRQPYLLFQSGFQLSFGAVWAIGGLGGLLNEALGAEKGWQRTLICSLCVQMVLAPATVWHYFRYPIYGLVLNLLVVPLAAVLVYSGILGILLGGFCQPAGVMAVGAGHYVLVLYEGLCGLFSGLPGYSLLVGRPGWGQILGYGAVMAVGVGVVVGRKTAGRLPGSLAGRLLGSLPGSLLGKLPGSLPGRLPRSLPGRPPGGLLGKPPGSLPGESPGFRWGGLVAVFLLYILCFCILLPRPQAGLSVTCLDVGQGDGLVFTCTEGTVLVDGGSSSRSGLGERCLKPYLESRAVETVDYAIVSHGDSDHVSGLLELMEGGGVRIRNLVLPRMARGQEHYAGLVRAAGVCGAQVLYMEAGERISLGDLQFTCLYAGNPAQETDTDKNRHSLAVRVSYGRLGLLLTGDMDASCEAGLLRTCGPGDLAGIQVLKAAHHGSDTSSSPEFLERLGPKLVLVSYGNGNSYGHPSPKVLERLRERGSRILETGKCGAILLWTDGKRMECRGWLGSDP